MSVSPNPTVPSVGEIWVCCRVPPELHSEEPDELLLDEDVIEDPELDPEPLAAVEALDELELLDDDEAVAVLEAPLLELADEALVELEEVELEPDAVALLDELELPAEVDEPLVVVEALDELTVELAVLPVDAELDPGTRHSPLPTSQV